MEEENNLSNRNLPKPRFYDEGQERFDRLKGDIPSGRYAARGPGEIPEYWYPNNQFRENGGNLSAIAAATVCGTGVYFGGVSPTGTCIAILWYCNDKHGEERPPHFNNDAHVLFQANTPDKPLFFWDGTGELSHHLVNATAAGTSLPVQQEVYGWPLNPDGTLEELADKLTDPGPIGSRP